jgi:hypothetical protein
MKVNQETKKRLLILWLTTIFSGICLLFWYNEWVYSLPTPVPAKYRDVKTGTYIDLAGKLKTENNNPVFIHFFNPDCPCSKFNIPHFKSLAQQYGDKINFAVVVLNNSKCYTEAGIRERFGLNIPVFFDPSLAELCGVYSTPQAVILDADHKLYYRGNYNKSRYCASEKSNYAKLAIDSLLSHNIHPVFNSYALTAYGCSLPNCSK